MPRAARITSWAAAVLAAMLAICTPEALAAGAPKPSIKSSSAKPAVGATLVLDGRASKCSPGPCRYLWTSQAKGKRKIKLGTARRVTVKLKTAGTLTISLRVTDKRKRAATKRLRIVVAAAPAPVPAPAFAPPQPVFVTPPAPAPSATPTASPAATPSPTPPAAPAAPVISSPADGTTFNVSTLTVSGTAATGTTVELFDDGASRGTTATTAAGTWSFVLSQVADGTHIYTAHATRPGSAPSPASAARTIRVDTVAPAAPMISTPAENALGNSSAVSLTGTAEPSATVEIRESDELLATTPVDAQGKWAQTLISLADGPHTFAVIARDAAGNPSASAQRTVRVDTTAPETTITSGPTGLTNADALSYSFSSSEPDSTFSCRIDGAWEPCASPKTYTTLADGARTFEVKATDLAGNEDASTATRTVTLDRTAPAAPLITGPAQDAWLNSATVTLIGTAEANAEIAVREGAETLGGTTADAQGGWTHAISAAADGSHTYTVTARDAAGNTSVAASRTLAVDTAAPETTITSGPTGLTNASPVTFAFDSSDPGSTFACRLDREAAPGAWTACASPASFTELADGEYTLRVKATDRAGNEDPSEVAAAFTLDRTPPPAPTVFAPALQNTPAVTLRGSADAGTVVELHEGEGALGTAAVDGQGNWELTLPAVADGSHTYLARARDAAGNRSTAADRTVVVDTTPPATTVDSGPPALTNAETLRFEFHASETGSRFACRLDFGTEFGEWEFCDNPKSYSGLPDGHYTFLVRATDAAGNTDDVIARHGFRLDRTPPSPPTVVAPALQNSATVDLSGTTEPFATIAIRSGAGEPTSIAVDSDGRWNHQFTGVADGAHAYAVTARDAAGNTSTATTHTVVVDTAGPQVTITAGPEGPITVPSATFEFSSEDGASFECRLTPADSEFRECDSPHTAAGLDAMEYAFQVRATDAAGNTGPVAERKFQYTPILAQTVYIAPEGDNTGTCAKEAPCAALARAYANVADGGVIEIGDGSYSTQRVPDGEKKVTIQGEDGSRPSMRRLEADADNLSVRQLVVEQLVIRGSRQTYDGVDVDGRFTQRLAFEHVAGDDNVFKNGSIGNVTDEKGAIVGGNRFTFDNVLFHDVRLTDPDVHNECMYASGAEGLTIRNSTFHACATHDIFFTSFVGGPEWGNVTLENNVFEHATMEAADSWHFYTVVVHPSVGGMKNWIVRYNTFETGVNNEMVASSGRWVGNLGDWNCAPGMTYRYNVGEACGDLDSGVFPSASTKTREAAFAWVDPAALDFRLKPTSPALDAGDIEDYPARDRAGNPRNVGWGPDAGAYERQETD